MRKRFISSLLVLCMATTLLPVKAWAAESGTALKEPAVTDLTVTYNDGGTDKTTSLLPVESNQPQIPLPADGQLTFQIRFDSWEQLDKVYVTSTKDNNVKYLEAIANGTAGSYTASGCFDPSDTNYIPGQISVEYTKKLQTVSEETIVQDLAKVKTELENYISVTNLTTSPDNSSIETALAIKGLLLAEEEVLITATISFVDEITGTELSDWQSALENYKLVSSYISDSSSTKYFLYQDYADKATYALLAKDGSKVAKFVLSGFDTKPYDPYHPGSTLTDITGALDQVNAVSSLIYNYLNIHSSAAELTEQITVHPTMTVAQKAEAYSKVDAYENDRQIFSIITTILPTIVAASGGTMAGPTIMFTALLGAINAAADTFWNYRIGMILGCETINTNFVSDAHGTPLTDEYLRANRNKITTSGTYYLTKNTSEDDFRRSFSIGDSDSGTSVDVTLCLHGYSCSANLAGDGSTLKICDCTYRENEDGTVVGGSASINGFYNNQTIFVESGTVGEIQMWAENTGTVIVNGGVVNYINMNHVDGNGRVIINGGTIGLGILAYGDESEIIINNGLVLAPVSSGQFSRAHIRTDSGNIKIYSGQICTSIEAGTGTLNIYDGDIVSSLKNDGGTVNINGGIVRSVENKSGSIIINGGEVKSIENHSNGTVHIRNDGIVGEQSSSQAAIANTGGSVTIDGGTIIGNVTNSWGRVDGIGEITINGGTILGCVSNDNSYNGKENENIERTKLTINGGKFQNDGDYCIFNRCGIVTISGGVFRGKYGIGSYDQSSTTLLINSNSRIEADCTESVYQNIGHAPPTLSVQADKGYNGGVTYYPSADATGIKVTIEEAAKIDYTQPYVCLVADGATGGPSGGNQEECEHNYTSAVTAPTCTERGYTTYTCGICNNVYIADYTNALGHSYGEWIVTKNATSTMAGQRERICSVCGDKEIETIPATGGGNSGSSGSGNSMGGGSYRPSVPSMPSTPSLPVSTNTTTQGGMSITQTTAVPTVSAQSGKVTATVNTSMGNEIVKQAVASNSANVVIAPSITGNVTRVEVSIPATFMSQIEAQSNASLTVSTPVADVTIPNGGLGSLSGTSGTVTVTAEKSGSTVELSVVANGRIVTSVSGGLTLTVPVSYVTPGTVAVLVYDDGTQEVVRKSVADNGSVMIPLDGSATLEIVDNSKYFYDVPATSWMADAVAFASAHELFNGTGANQFNPNLPMSRGMLAVVLHNLESNPYQPLSATFSDVDNSTWYAEGVTWAAANGIVDGYGNGQFGPGDNITREQLAVMLWRYAGKPITANRTLNFADADKASSWAMDALLWATEIGVINGKGNGILDPTGFATRAETAQMLKNYLEK